MLNDMRLRRNRKVSASRPVIGRLQDPGSEKPAASAICRQVSLLVARTLEDEAA
jgi:hypothetical protein